MHVVLSFLRGLVLYTEIEADEAFIEAQLAIMTSALIEILGARRNKGGRSRSQAGEEVDMRRVALSTVLIVGFAGAALRLRLTL